MSVQLQDVSSVVQLNQRLSPWLQLSCEILAQLQSVSSAAVRSLSHDLSAELHVVASVCELSCNS